MGQQQQVSNKSSSFCFFAIRAPLVPPISFVCPINLAKNQRRTIPWRSKCVDRGRNCPSSGLIFLFFFFQKYYLNLCALAKVTALTLNSTTNSVTTSFMMSISRRIDSTSSPCACRKQNQHDKRTSDTKKPVYVDFLQSHDI